MGDITFSSKVVHLAMFLYSISTQQMNDTKSLCVLRDFNVSVQASKLSEDCLHSYLKPYPKPGQEAFMLTAGLYMTMMLWWLGLEYIDVLW